MNNKSSRKQYRENRQKDLIEEIKAALQNLKI